MLNWNSATLSRFSNTEIFWRISRRRQGRQEQPGHGSCHRSPRAPGEDRYLMGLTHLGGIGRNWSTYLDINRVSDNDYLVDLGNLSPGDNQPDQPASYRWRNL